MGNLQVILNVLDFGMTAQEAISAPRFAATSDTIELCNRIRRSTERALQGQGYRTRRHPQAYKYAWVHAIRIDDTVDGTLDGRFDGGADPATDGMAALSRPRHSV